MGRRSTETEQSDHIYTEEVFIFDDDLLFEPLNTGLYPARIIMFIWTCLKIYVTES